MVLVSVGDLEGLQITLEVLSDSTSIAMNEEALAEINGGSSGGMTVRMRSEIVR